MICNPMLQGGNPFEAWQKLWLQGLNQGMSAMQVQAPAKQDLPQVTDMFGQFNAMQNMWMSTLMPQQPNTTAPTNPFMPFGNVPMPSVAPQMPKITVTTIELGDMRPYMEMASSMINAFAPMLQNGMNGFGSFGGRK